MLRIRRTAAVAGRLAAGAMVPVVLAGVATGPAVRQRPAFPRLSRLSRPTGASGAAIAAKDTPATTTRSVFKMAAIRHFGPPADASGYSVIVVTGPRRAWVFGGTNPGGSSAPVAALWNGAAITSVTLPSGLGSFVSVASTTSSADVWAASQYGRYVLHFDGTRWRVVRRWQRGQVTGLTAVTRSDVWVFGTTAGGNSSIGTWHYDGTSWQRVTGLAGSVCRASAVSATDIWGIAASPASYSIVRFDGTSWAPVLIGAALSGVQPRDILARSARDVWILGTKAATSGGVRLVLLHWNGHRWATLLTRINAWAGRLAAGVGDSVLVTATPASASASGLILQASATGSRLVVGARLWLGSGGISDVALVGRSHAMWASGAVLTRLGGDAVIWTGQFPAPEDRVGT